MKILRSLFFLSVLVIAGLSGFAAPAQAADKLKVMLDWFVNPDHATLLVAKYIGAYQAEGLDVELIAPADPNTPARLVAAKQVDLALSYEPALHLMAEQKLPVVRVGTLIDSPLQTVTVRADGPIKTLADLKGKKIGYPVAGVAQAMIGAMLESVGLKSSDVTLVNVNFQQVQALMSGKVDGGVGFFRNFDVNELRLKGVKPLVFYPEEHGVPLYDELIVIANRDSVHDPRLPRFFRAVQRGATYLINHPEETWEMFVKDHPDLNNELNKIAWTATLPRFAKTPALLDAGRYQAFAAFMLKSGMISRTLPVTDYAVQVQ